MNPNRRDSLPLTPVGDEMSDEILETKDVEKIVELSKRVSQLETEIDGYKTKISDYENTIQKNKDDIVRLQKIISDNFVASKETPKSEISAPKNFADVYKEMIEQNAKSR